ncbi:MAG: type II toxin-antitoxin system RelE/ParE family toxin [Desulfamplus sp.]|nr:type II toxin-antitoxin system RelE/ParE family toxin [Desulfamplus sp.]
MRRTIPFREWLDSLKDRRAQAKVDIRINKMRAGNLGDTKPVGKGVHELRIDYGPGYRVYYANEDSAIVVLLCGGDKRKQDKDIKATQEYWADYKRR